MTPRFYFNPTRGKKKKGDERTILDTSSLSRPGGRLGTRPPRGRRVRYICIEHTYRIRDKVWGSCYSRPLLQTADDIILRLAGKSQRATQLPAPAGPLSRETAGKKSAVNAEEGVRVALSRVARLRVAQCFSPTRQHVTGCDQMCNRPPERGSPCQNRGVVIALMGPRH